MGKATNSKRIRRAEPTREVTGYDATPERLAKEDSEIVDTFRDPGETALRKARRFRKPHLDRWHAAGMIDQRQWAAGDAYRTTYERCQMRLSVVASYGERTGAGTHPGDFGYGLPRLTAQAEARSRMHAMRSVFLRGQAGTMDRFILRDEMPRFSGRRHTSLIAEIRDNLDELALYLSKGR